MNPLQKIEYLIVHHTERNNDFPSFIRLRHKFLRGWEDIGYHYLIGNTRPFTEEGKIYSGRSEDLEGAHAFGHNKNSLGICLIGNLDKTIPSEGQLESLFTLLEQKINQYSVSIGNVLGHNELPNVTKSCPGKLLNMNYVRAVLSKQEDFLFSSYAEILGSILEPA